MDNSDITIRGDLSKLLNAIRNAGEVMGYKDLERISGIHMAKAHYYAQALEDLGLVKIDPVLGKDGIIRMRIRVVEEAGKTEA